VWGLDPDLLALVPRPVRAVFLLYPLGATAAALSPGGEAAEGEVTAPPEGGPGSGPGAVFAAGSAPGVPWFTRQTIGNACGTVALLHAVAAAAGAAAPSGPPAAGPAARPPLLSPDGFLSRFLLAASDLDPAQRADLLERPPPGAPSLAALHAEAAGAGQSRVPAADADVDLHFVALVEGGAPPGSAPTGGERGESLSAGWLWELDGRRRGPVCHGRLPTGAAGGEGGGEGGGSGPDLLAGAAAVARARVANAGGSLQFNVMCLAKPGTAFG